MTESTSSQTLHRPLISILLTLLCFFIGFQVIGPLLGSLIAIPFFDGTLTEFSKALTDVTKYPGIKVPLLLMQGFAAIFGLIFIPYLLLRRQNRTIASLSEEESWHLQPALLVPIIVIVSMSIISVIVEWNQKIDLPDMFGFESWARNMEDRLEDMTRFIIDVNNTGEIILTMVVIAVIPAIGEELVFRGMIQRDFLRATGNIHVAIWVSAIIFSAIHLQFYGFFPRVFLGALFGYLYYWSGNLVMPMIAHFANNGFTLLGVILYRQGKLPIDMESSEAAPVEAVIISSILFILLMYSFRTFYIKHARPDNVISNSTDSSDY